MMQYPVCQLWQRYMFIRYGEGGQKAWVIRVSKVASVAAFPGRAGMGCKDQGYKNGQ